MGNRFRIFTVVLLSVAMLVLLGSQDAWAQTDTSPHTEHLVQVNGVTVKHQPGEW